MLYLRPATPSPHHLVTYRFSAHQRRLLAIMNFEHARALQHLLGAAAAMLADRRAVEHCGQLHDALVVREALHDGVSAVGAEELGDRVVRIAEGGHLRQVSDTDHLVLLADA